MVCVSPAAAPLESISPLLAAQIISAHPKDVSLSRLWAVQTSTHSCLTLSPAQQELPEPACLLDLPKHRLDRLLAQARPLIIPTVGFAQAAIS
jgi:hypothetical protein